MFNSKYSMHDFHDDDDTLQMFFCCLLLYDTMYDKDCVESNFSNKAILLCVSLTDALL